MRTTTILGVMALFLGCGDDEHGSEAIRHGVGAECAVDTDCQEEGQACLTQFKGGYCGVSACTGDVDCPGGSACVTEDDGVNYCFLVCLDKPDCNVTRSLENEANCTSSLPFVDDQAGRKVCRPPMSGI